MASIDEMKVAQMVKLSQSLLKSLRDGNQYNDVKIVLDDGDLEASKFVLSSRSEYFYKMFDKSHKFQENLQRDVKVSCKKVVMEQILTYLYGGEISIDGLSLIDAVELLDMLRQKGFLVCGMLQFIISCLSTIKTILQSSIG